jgi:hypothetical protein
MTPVMTICGVNIHHTAIGVSYLEDSFDGLRRKTFFFVRDRQGRIQSSVVVPAEEVIL